MCEFHSVDQEKLSGWGHIAVACVGKRRGAYRVWVGKCEGKRALVCVCARARACVREGGGRDREDNTKLDFQEGAWTGLIWPRTRTGGGQF